MLPGAPHARILDVAVPVGFKTQPHFAQVPFFVNGLLNSIRQGIAKDFSGPPRSDKCESKGFASEGTLHFLG